jgi:hypothetical protein
VADRFKTNLIGRRVFGQFAKFGDAPAGNYEGEVVAVSLVEGVLRVYVARLSDGRVEFCKQGEYRLKYPCGPGI